MGQQSLKKNMKDCSASVYVKYAAVVVGLLKKNTHGYICNTLL